MLTFSTVELLSVLCVTPLCGASDYNNILVPCISVARKNDNTTGGHFATTCGTPVSCLYRKRPVQGPVTALSGPRRLSNPVLYPVWVYV